MAEQLRQLTSALSVYQQTGQVEQIPVRLGALFSVLCENVAELALERRVELRVIPTRAVIASDPILLGSALENLVRNAVKFTGPAGRVLLGLRRCRRPGSHRGPRYGYWHSVGASEKLFEAFHRLDPRSDRLGLGLFIANRAVKLLRHKIEAQSVVARGSCFAIVTHASERPSCRTHRGAPDDKATGIIGQRRAPNSSS